MPPNKSMQDKYYLGFFNDKELIAVMDVIEGYPSKETIFWGLFMMASDYAGKGLGSQIVQECLRALKEQGFLAVRLAYRKENPQSKAFWEKCGFLPTGVETQNGQGIVVVMEKSYKRKSAAQSGIASNKRRSRSECKILVLTVATI